MEEAKKILLRLPNWLGDSVMMSASFELLKTHFKNADFILVGSVESCGIYARDKRVKQIFIDSTKNAPNRLKATKEFAKNFSQIDIAISFTNSIFSALFLRFTKAKIRIGYAKNFRFVFLNQRPKFIKNLHQVELYYNLIANLIKQESITKRGENSDFLKLKLISQHNKKFEKDFMLLKKNTQGIIGINPGAAYGSAKRWEEKYFIEIILYFLKNDFGVVLFGNALDGAFKDIDKILLQLGAPSQYFLNLVGKTDICDLIDCIKNLDLFITNDSGPMHIASALGVKIIAIFGPTNSTQTSPWNKNAIILNKNLPCAPCMKRTCPLIHHNCMKLINPDEVIECAQKILTRF